MAKIKTTYVCSNCGTKTAKWVGRCSACGEWNTFQEEVVKKETKTRSTLIVSDEVSVAKTLPEIDILQEKRIITGNGELDRVLGGGVVPGSVILLGGEPGIGKSTLALQIALALKDKLTLYISGEESLSQIKLRANRLNIPNDTCKFLNETSMDVIGTHLKRINPQVVVLDSIQTVTAPAVDSLAGSVTQIRECTTQLIQYAKQNSVPIFIIGHINKDGNIAGPKVLEHLVDTVLQFEGDRNYMYRIVRSAKNRYGSTDELGIYEMQSNGLREVSNPSELLLSQNSNQSSGVSVAAGVEGMRAFLIETQALVSSAVYGTPQRSATGFDIRRLNMLLAVLEKRLGFRLSAKDVFLNIAGGIKVVDPAIDLPIIMAILSSDRDVEIDKHICFAGEIGLSGEVRPVNRVEQRINEAERLGFKQIFIPKNNNKSFDTSKFNIKINFVENVRSLAYLFN